MKIEKLPRGRVDAFKGYERDIPEGIWRGQCRGFADTIVAVSIHQSNGKKTLVFFEGAPVTVADCGSSSENVQLHRIVAKVVEVSAVSFIPRGPYQKRDEFVVKAIYPVTCKTFRIPAPIAARAVLSAVFLCRGGLVQPVGYEVRRRGSDEIELKCSFEDIERLKATYARVRKH